MMHEGTGDRGNRNSSHATPFAADSGPVSIKEIPKVQVHEAPMLPEADNSRLVTVHLTDNSSSHSEAASPKEHTFAIDQLPLDTIGSDLEEDEAEEEPEEDAYRLEIPSTNLGAMELTDKAVTVSPKKGLHSIGVATWGAPSGSEHDNTFTGHELQQPILTGTGTLVEQVGSPSGSAAGGGRFGGAGEDNSASLGSGGGTAPSVADLAYKAPAANMVPSESLVTSASSSSSWRSTYVKEPNSDLGGGLPALSTIVDHEISPPMASVSEAGKRAISTGLGKMEGPYSISSMPPGFHSSRARSPSSNTLFSRQLEAPSAGDEGSNFLSKKHFTHDYPLGGMGLDPSPDMPGIGAFGAPATQTGRGSGGLGGAPAWNPFGSSILEAGSVTSPALELIQQRSHSGLPVGGGLPASSISCDFQLSLPVTEASNRSGPLGTDLGIDNIHQFGPSLLSGFESNQALLPSRSTCLSSRRLEAPAAGKLRDSQPPSNYPPGGLGMEPPLGVPAAIGAPGTLRGQGTRGAGGASAWKPFGEPILELLEDPFDAEVHEMSTSTGRPTVPIASAAATTTAGVRGAEAGAEGPSKKAVRPALYHDSRWGSDTDEKPQTAVTQDSEGSDKVWVWNESSQAAMTKHIPGDESPDENEDECADNSGYMENIAKKATFLTKM